MIDRALDCPRLPPTVGAGFFQRGCTMQESETNTLDSEKNEAALAAVGAAFDAVGDIRVRLHTLLAAINRDHLTALDAIEALQGIERQSERIIEMAGQLRAEMTRAAWR
jgi:hypothetical protein